MNVFFIILILLSISSSMNGSSIALSSSYSSSSEYLSIGFDFSSGIALDGLKQNGAQLTSSIISTLS